MRLPDFLDFHARERPDSEFAVMGDRTVTYSEASKRINQLANAFTSAGLNKGDRVAFLSKNSIEYMYMYYAGARSGVVPVPLNYRLAPNEWAYIINDSQSKMLMVSSEYQESVDGVWEELEAVDQFVSVGASNRGNSSEEWTDFDTWVNAQSDSAPLEEISANDDIFQMYTSGTTGHPKGVILTHDSLTSNLVQFAPDIPMSPGHRTLVAAPLYHIAGAFNGFYALYQGGCLIIHEIFDPAEVVKTLDEEKINWAILVPAIIQACLIAVPDVDQRKFTDLEIIAYGASPIAEETLSRGLEVFNCDFVQVYGQTELSPIATIMTSADHRMALNGRPELLLSAGRAALGTDLRIVDEDDNQVPNGTMGAICVRGPQIMKAYWNLPEATAEMMRGG
jgi:acyl-CoA synthetase (AMP-forming)/AMP-acid ligase II